MNVVGRMCRFFVKNKFSRKRTKVRVLSDGITKKAIIWDFFFCIILALRSSECLVAETKKTTKVVNNNKKYYFDKS